MEYNLEQLILNNYHFLEIKNLAKANLGGLMNENYVFNVLEKKYFVKIYKYYTEKKVRISHIIIDHIKKQGLGTYTLVKNTAGNTFSNDNGLLFEISEFINDAVNQTEETVSEKLLTKMAGELAIYHKAMIKINIDLEFINIFSGTDIKNNFQKIEEILISKTNFDNFDKLCLDMVRVKINYIEKIPNLLENISLEVFPVLVNHGDFTTGNCMFDFVGNLRYIIDFEHSINTYRLWDVIKTSAFLARKNKHEIFHSEINIDTLIYFLKKYHQQNILTVEELTALPDLYMIASILSDFVLHGYYLEDNKKAKEISSLSKKDWLWWFDNKESVRKRIFQDIIKIDQDEKNKN